VHISEAIKILTQHNGWHRSAHRRSEPNIRTMLMNRIYILYVMLAALIFSVIVCIILNMIDVGIKSENTNMYLPSRINTNAVFIQIR